MNNKLVRTKEARVTVKLPVMTQEREILAVGKAHHWPFRVLGSMPVPTQPIFANEWWLMPAHLDTSPLPERAMQRMQAVLETGITPKAWVIAHQAKKQLAPPAGTRIVSPTEYWANRVLQSSLSLLKGAGTLAAVVAPIVLSVLGTGLLLGVGVAGALVADPVLCVIVDDEVWIEIDRWEA